MDLIFQPAMKAAKRGDLNEFESILDANPKILDARSSVSHPSLAQFIVVDGGLGTIPQPLEFLDAMLRRKVIPDSIIVAAASVNAGEIIDALMGAGASIEAGAPWTPLEEALYWQHQTLAHHLIEQYGAKIGSLRAAAELGRLELLHACFGADGKLTSDAGQVAYPFGYVCAEAGAIVNQALFLALRNGQFDAADQLLKRGANPNTIVMGHHEHCAPLHQAVYLDSADMVDWLLQRGARVDVVDPRFNGTPIDWAKHFDRKNILELLENGHLAGK